jgi:hypothetical protein
VHGIFLGTHAVLRRAGWTPSSVVLNRLVTFLLVCVAFVIFHSPNLSVAGDVLSSMLGLHGLDASAQLHALVPLKFALLAAVLLMFVNVAPNTWQVRLKPRAWQGMAAGIATAVAVMTMTQPHHFIYFQF